MHLNFSKVHASLGKIDVCWVSVWSSFHEVQCEIWLMLMYDVNCDMALIHIEVQSLNRPVSDALDKYM